MPLNHRGINQRCSAKRLSYVVLNANMVFIGREIDMLKNARCVELFVCGARKKPFLAMIGAASMAVPTPDSDSMDTVKE